MEIDKKYRRVTTEYKSTPDAMNTFLAGIYEFAKRSGFHAEPSTGNFVFSYFREDGVEVQNIIFVKQTQTAVRIELRGWPFKGEDQLVQFFKSYGLEIRHLFRFTVSSDSRSAIQEAIEQTIQQVGISKYFIVDTMTRIRVVDVRVTAIGEYGDYCSEIFFNILGGLS